MIAHRSMNADHWVEFRAFDVRNSLGQSVGRVVSPAAMITLAQDEAERIQHPLTVFGTRHVAKAQPEPLVTVLPVDYLPWLITLRRRADLGDTWAAAALAR